MAITIRGTLASHPAPSVDRLGRSVHTFHVAVTPHVRQLRRGERREDYIRTVAIELSDLPNVVCHPLGTPVTARVTDCPGHSRSGLVYRVGPDQVVFH